MVIGQRVRSGYDKFTTYPKLLKQLPKMLIFKKKIMRHIHNIPRNGTSNLANSMEQRFDVEGEWRSRRE